jgi:hypothetical protein
MIADAPVQRPDSYDDLLRDMKTIAEDLRGIQELGVAQYTPVVEQIIATRSRDAHHIQRTLDYLLDFACHPAGLALYKTLCRYYYTLDPAATADYVNYYREMWDSEEAEELRRHETRLQKDRGGGDSGIEWEVDSAWRVG